MDKARKQQFIIKVCCVIAAFVLWLFITSTENPLTTYKVKSIPVQLLNTDTLTRSNLVLVPGQDLTTSLNIKGANTSILLNAKAENFKVVADLSAYALKSGEQNIPIEIRTSPDNVNVVNSDSLFIKINLDDLKQTKLPISVNISGKPTEGFFASAPKLSQDYATVVGGSKFVNLVKKILLVENIQGIQSNVSKTYKLKPVDQSGEEVKEVSVSPAQIDVKIPVSKTKSLGVAIKTTGTLNSRYTLASTKATPEKFDVTGSSNVLSEVKTLNTENIDLSKIDKSTTMKVKVIVPDGLTLVNGNATTEVQLKLDKVNSQDTTEVIQNDVDKLAQKTISQNINYTNLGENYGVKLGNDKVSLVISGKQAIINSLDIAKISAEVDLSNLVEGSYTIPVKVSIPDGVNLVSEAPNKISVTLTKKQTEGTISNDNKGK
ncbi:hypothetical protein LGK95_16450 [Clostridium algoriphilum]|uniref:CdaR family protein n=1 Tax=Clostridium algoriphilum TaxID=198347 RepID=UPI001CF5C0E2|nr:CdaR family protein [Clostridium algoriphilum]MCB2295075.1 hypothetical protein [Clostridium algoriphilum]